jgi:hypothetical protein
MIKVFRQSSIASLTYAKIAAGIIVDSIVADRCADPTKVAYIVKVSYFLVVVFMAYRTIFFGAGRNPTNNTV